MSAPSKEAPVTATVVKETDLQKQLDQIKKKEDEKKRKEMEVQKKQEELKKKQAELEKKEKELKKKQEQEKIQQAEQKKKKEQEAIQQAKLKKEQEEKQRKEAELKRKKEEELKRKKEQERKKQLAEEQRRKKELEEQIRAENIRRLVNSALSQYVPIIRQKVSRNWNQPASLQGNIEAHVNVRLTRTGEVISARIVKSSGNPVFDRSVENAVLKASPLPIPQERDINDQFRDLTLRFKPEDLFSWEQ